MSTLVLLTLILLTLLCIYLWNRRHLYAAAAHFCGPFALPFIGNGFTLMCDLEDFFDKLNGILKQYEGCNDPLRLWFGPHLVIALRDPVHLEKIMTSQKFAHKSDMMDIVKYYWGEGLISASGAIYRKQKKVIQPIFDLSYTESAMDLFHKHTNICMEKLNEFVGRGTFNIYEYISLFAVDLTGEVIAGQNIRSQEFGRTDFCDSLVDMYKVCVTRISTVWQHSEILFNFASQKKRHDKVRRDFSNFTQKAIDDSRARRKSEYTQTNDKFLPAIDILTKLDEDCSDLFTNQELKDNLVTLFAATEDPLGLISSFSVLCFGMYPEYQKKAVEEIRKVIGENPREVTIQDLRELEYLDMCVKDVLRLFPIAPFMLRKVTEDYKLGKYILTKVTT
nr:cytochrome P450 4c3-like [Leptinotarsa decemlineata]